MISSPNTRPIEPTRRPDMSDPHDTPGYDSTRFDGRVALVTGAVLPVDAGTTATSGRVQG
jgi:hypothetical protein